MDDLAQNLVGINKAEIEEDAVASVTFIFKELEKKGIKVSQKKSVILPRSDSLVIKIASRLRMNGIIFGTADTGRDLVLDAASGKKRAVGTGGSRFVKGSARVKRIRILAMANKGAKKLFAT